MTCRVGIDGQCWHLLSISSTTSVIPCSCNRVTCSILESCLSVVTVTSVTSVASAYGGCGRKDRATNFLTGVHKLLLLKT